MSGRRPDGVVALVALAVALTAVLSGCARSLPADQVSATIVAQLKQQGTTVDDDALSCPGDFENLPVEVGRTVRCGFTAGGQPADAVATVSSVDGDRVNFEVVTEAKPVPQQLLERTVAGEIAKANLPVERVACAGPLEPRVGQKQTCTSTAGGQARTLVTTVTEVRGGFVRFAIAQS